MTSKDETFLNQRRHNTSTSRVNDEIISIINLWESKEML